MTGMNRKQFLAGGAGGMVLLWLQACGGGGDDAGNGNGGFPPVLTSCGSDGVAIAGNHGHAVIIAVADLNSTTAKSYSIHGTADHDHLITLTVTQLQTLKSGASVIVTSTTTPSTTFGTHAHQVTVTCV